ncbi:general secretion pathway protein GspK [Thiolapillus sp.]|uniref:general secretion pathway protein GspK n=1 Tax=Thiolapillus sp. TaxID=2017437 RepID=UPI003AF65258
MSSYPETGKIDLNYADQRTLVKLFESIEIDEVKASELADAILDWRDKNELYRLNGAERSEYEAAGKAYGPRNGPFETIEEVQLVLGMDAGIYTAIEDMITIYAKKDKVDLKKAPFKVLRVFFDEQEMAEQELLDAAEEDGEKDMPADPVKQGVAYSFYSRAVLPDRQSGSLMIVAKYQKNSRLGFSMLRWKSGVADESLFTGQFAEISD